MSRDHNTQYILEGIIFEWDANKALVNRRKHGVSFQEAATTFFDPEARIYDDPEHSSEEVRFLLVGMSACQRELLIVSVERSERIRLISARRLTTEERRAYEEGS